MTLHCDGLIGQPIQIDREEFRHQIGCFFQHAARTRTIWWQNRKLRASYLHQLKKRGLQG